MSLNLIDLNFWVFYPRATQQEIKKYLEWFAEHLNYTPYIDTNLIYFESTDDLLLFRLSFSELL